MQAKPPFAEIVRSLEALDALAAELPGARVRDDIETLRRDIQADFFSVVFVGEFNRGKSTLINALLGQELLPTDVTPTTANISILRYGPTAGIRLHRRGQAPEDRSSASLAEILRGSEDTAGLDYVEIVLPSVPLSDGTVLVDTPGLDDLDRQRVAVTSRFIPRADSVVFALTARSPLSRSEMDFLVGSVLKSGVGRLVFAVNFADALDDEERIQVRAQLQSRIRAALPEHSGEVCLVSGRGALEATRRGDAEALAASGLPELRAAIARLAERRVSEKTERLAFRLGALMGDLAQEIAAAVAVAQASHEALRRQIADLEADASQSAARRQWIDDWRWARERELREMLQKSLRTFGAELVKDVSAKVRGFQGADLKNFTENVIVPDITRRFKFWIDGHWRALDAFLQQVDRQVWAALARHFQTRMLPVRRAGVGWETAAVEVEEVGISADEKDRRWMVKSGAVAGGLSTAMLVIGAPALAPLVALSIFPVLRDRFMGSSQEKAKKSLLATIEPAIERAADLFEERLTGMIEQEINAIVHAATERYAALAASQHERARRALEQGGTSPEKTGSEVTRLGALAERLRHLMASGPGQAELAVRSGS